MLLLAAFVYFAFFVPVGEHTLYRHAVRIGSTSEAQELWGSLYDAGLGLKDRFSDALSNRAVAQPEEPARD